MTDAVSLIRAKRDGQRLADADIKWLFEAYARHEVADEQMSALLMAIYFRGLDGAELRTWTAAMIASGDRLDLSSVGRPTVDKHSTGGVGDKVSLILAPLVAACGAAVPQLSGRGLGHTGGTLDKLESIPGFRAGLTPDETLAVLASVGCVICAAGSGLAPADRRLYALRDVTATVESIPLIASSIMSKKIAEGTSALVLDVKVGSGAFMTSYERARELAETMVALGEEHGVRSGGRGIRPGAAGPRPRRLDGSHPRAGPADARAGRPGWRQSWRSRRGHRRRPGAGRLPGDGPRAGR
jgi:thymidine phosphorylase